MQHLCIRHLEMTAVLWQVQIVILLAKEKNRDAKSVHLFSVQQFPIVLAASHYVG